MFVSCFNTLIRNHDVFNMRVFIYKITYNDLMKSQSFCSHRCTLHCMCMCVISCWLVILISCCVFHISRKQPACGLRGC